MGIPIADNGNIPPLLSAGKDLAVTLILWGYFTLGFIFLFAPFYLFCFCFARDRQASFRKLNSRFYRGFFSLCRYLIPRCKWLVDEQVENIRGAVIVCNHLSYLDSIFLISLFDRHTTIVKNRLFKIPFFGSMLKLSGYLPTSGDQDLVGLMMRRMDGLGRHLSCGGNLIVFPEGTRSRSGAVGDLQPGAFKIARLCRAPVKVLRIENTDQLFTPGKFSFNTGRSLEIRLKVLDEFYIEAGRDNLTKAVLRVRSLFPRP